MGAGALWGNRHSSVSPKKITFAFLQHPEEHGETINKVGGDPGDMLKVLFATCENNGSIC